MFAYGPLLATFLNVSGATLKMIDIQGPLPKHKHDAILRIIEPYHFDIMFVEAKPCGRGVEKDKEKLGHAMAHNLHAMKRKHGQMDDRHLRTYGIQFSGAECDFLEAQIFRDIPVVYSVHKMTIPKEYSGLHRLGHGVNAFLAFKARIQSTICEIRSDHLKQCILNP